MASIDDLVEQSGLDDCDVNTFCKMESTASASPWSERSDEWLHAMLGVRSMAMLACGELPPDCI